VNEAHLPLTKLGYIHIISSAGLVATQQQQLLLLLSSSSFLVVLPYFIWGFQTMKMKLPVRPFAARTVAATLHI
jgi:hypothetical protein